MAKQLPAYFKEYLDERFSHVVSKITEQGISLGDDVSDLAKEMKRMNGSVAAVQAKVNTMDSTSRKNLAVYLPQFRKTKKDVTKNRRYLLIALIAILLLGVAFFDRENISVATLVSLFSGL